MLELYETEKEVEIFNSCLSNISSLRFDVINKFPTSVNLIDGLRRTKPNDFGARFILSLALRSKLFFEPFPLKNLL